MFESGESQQVGAEAPGVLSGVPESEWTGLLRERHAAIARAQFLEVDAVASVYLARCADDARRGCNEAFQGEFAHTEVGMMLTVTEPVARRWIGLGLDLRWRLHATSEAFASGRIDQTRAQAISDAMANVSADKVEMVERLLLDGIKGATTTMIRRTARRLIARHDPAGATARREQGEIDRDVRFRANDDGTCSVDGTLPGPAGQVVAMRLRKMCFEVCGGDPRTFAQRRADALVALADGSGRLLCLCGRTDCPRAARVDATANEARADYQAPSPTTPAPRDPEHAVPASWSTEPVTELLTKRGAEHRDAADGSASRSQGGSHLPPLPPATVHVGVNVTTLLGLDDHPGYLAGHGWIDASLVRSIAADGTWRKVLTLTDADREALLDALCGHTGRGDHAEAPADSISDEAWLSGRRIETRAHGTILGLGRALAAAGITSAAIRARSRHRREQLTYRPSDRLAEIVRARDGICRFPGCTVRAIACDLDHTVPFDHAQPEAGGWTVEQNLACLCRRHHRLKTAGLWKVRQLGSGRLEWTTPTGELVITEPAGEFSDEPMPPGAPRAGLPETPPPAGDTASLGEDESPPDASTVRDLHADAEIAEAYGLTLTEPDTLARLFGQPRGRGVEDDLKYILDVWPKPAADVVPATDVDGLARSVAATVVDAPAPF